MSRSIRGFLSCVMIMMYAMASYATSHSPAIEKANSETVSQFYSSSWVADVIFKVTGIDAKNSGASQFGIVTESFIEKPPTIHYVPVKIGKVINKPIANYKYRNLQHWYLSPRNRS